MNEQGTEAAAATAVLKKRARKQQTPISFVADRPFVMVIYHATLDCILFIGQVLDPTVSGSGGSLHKRKQPHAQADEKIGEEEEDDEANKKRRVDEEDGKEGQGQGQQ